MGAYNTVPFFRVDKVHHLSAMCLCTGGRGMLRRVKFGRCGRPHVYLLLLLQGFVAQCTDVLGNRLVPLDARQQVRPPAASTSAFHVKMTSSTPHPCVCNTGGLPQLRVDADHGSASCRQRQRRRWARPIPWLFSPCSTGSAGNRLCSLCNCRGAVQGILSTMKLLSCSCACAGAPGGAAGCEAPQKGDTVHGARPTKLPFALSTAPPLATL